MDRYHYRLGLENDVLTFKVHDDREVRIKLLAPKERVKEFRGAAVK